MLPLSLAWAEKAQGDIALAAGGSIAFKALEESEARLLVLTDPWRTTAEEIDFLASSNTPVCPIFSFLPKLLNANQPQVEEPVFSESYVCIQSADISEALLEQIAVLRAMGARFDGPISFTRNAWGYIAQSGNTVLCSHISSASSHIEAQTVSSSTRLEVNIPGGRYGKPARIRVATQLSEKECPPRFESGARLTWRRVLEYLHSSAYLPYGLQQLSDDIELCRRMMD
jgi:hypothetical protein